MPICSLAAAICRSAMAMSGRRSSNCDGRPGGMDGGVYATTRAGILSVAGG